MFIKGTSPFDKGNREEAEIYFTLLNNQYSNKKGILNKLGIIKMKDKEYGPAIDYFKRCISLDKTFVPAYTNLGISNTKMQQYIKAEESYFNLLKIQPNHTKAHLNLSILYTKIKNKEKALFYTEKAVRLSGGKIKAKAEYYLGLAQVLSGDTVTAK